MCTIVCLIGVGQQVFPPKSLFLPSKHGKSSFAALPCVCINILRKMLILLIRSCCKICPLLTIANSTNTQDCYCWQWSNFTMGPNEQNQHFVELRQKVCLHIHAVVLQRGLPSLEGKNELFVGKKRKKRLANSSQTEEYIELYIYSDNSGIYVQLYMYQNCTILIRTRIKVVEYKMTTRGEHFHEGPSL